LRKKIPLVFSVRLSDRELKRLGKQKKVVRSGLNLCNIPVEIHIEGDFKK